MSLLELLAIAAGWAAVIFVICAAWHAMHSKRVRSIKAVPRCECYLCKMEHAASGGLLSEKTLGDIKLAAVCVSNGAIPYAALRVDYASTKGLGALAVIVVDGALASAVIEPAVRAHLGTRSGA